MNVLCIHRSAMPSTETSREVTVDDRAVSRMRNGFFGLSHRGAAGDVLRCVGRDMMMLSARLCLATGQKRQIAKEQFPSPDLCTWSSFRISVDLRKRYVRTRELQYGRGVWVARKGRRNYPVERCALETTISIDQDRRNQICAGANVLEHVDL